VTHARDCWTARSFTWIVKPQLWRFRSKARSRSTASRPIVGVEAFDLRAPNPAALRCQFVGVSLAGDEDLAQLQAGG
jgi:hypothetical protein